ncbi:acetyl-CoA carboxylase biotin carboxyl carrier protein subunit [Taibaiella sp. KBW10]|uniref:biotin/lipoyl-containing protein n=1 Tax=Taibaiella sp. KBW10 TaxID=2153357 RepID=UPI000F599377|nr:acetyl-CoA carboxylase biotin carboxyl carrier protein subunit [Taibaiella sp. KBW10]RQO31280.1 acetyl-CoA carboxylase biotin carboxyl carrier protein subunit [Taibaiella sp. KBW10]
MYNVKFSDAQELAVSVDQDQVLVNDKKIDWDAVALPNASYTIIANNKSYVASVVQVDRAKKTLSLSVNNNLYDIQIQEPIDILLSKMGLDISKMQKIEPIKAPMPGLILKILVTEGQVIKKGEPVLILEAMKMENIFKAPNDATVKAIKITERQAVEKGEILIELA